MIQILKYSQMKDVADAVQACIDHGGMSLWSALVDVMAEVDGISVEPDCRYTQCDHGMGLAGKGNCPAGNPTDRECAEFTTEYARGLK